MIRFFINSFGFHLDYKSYLPSLANPRRKCRSDPENLGRHPRKVACKHPDRRGSHRVWRKSRESSRNCSDCSELPSWQHVRNCAGGPIHQGLRIQADRYSSADRASCRRMVYDCCRASPDLARSNPQRSVDADATAEDAGYSSSDAGVSDHGGGSCSCTEGNRLCGLCKGD